MPSPEELEEQEFIYFQKIRELQTYLMETRRIRGDISVIDYRCNSVIDSGYEQVQRKERLESELKEKNSELRRNHCLSPGKVESRIGQYEYEIWKISRQLDGMPGNNNVETPLQRRYRADMQDAGQKQAPSKVEEEKSRLEEQYGQESEQAYKLGQERQYRDNHSETINRHLDKKVTMVGCVSYMNMEDRSILPVKERGQRIMILEFRMPDSGSGKVTHRSYGKEIHDFEKAPGHIGVRFPYHSSRYGNPYGSRT